MNTRSQCTIGSRKELPVSAGRLVPEAVWRALLIALLAGAVAVASAASTPLTWRWSNPRPHGNNIADMAFRNGLFVTVGEDGFVASSGDGINWQRQNSGVTGHLNRVLWLQNRFVVAGESGRVITSADARTWQSVTMGAANSLYCA